MSDPPRRQKLRAAHLSFAIHALLIAAFVLVPVLWPSPLPEHPDAIRALLYDPPPPPPPPLPKGSALAKKLESARPVTPEAKPDPEKLITPDERPKEEELKPEAKVPEAEQAGVESGSELGTPEGMEGGIEGGQVGGVPGGVLGGVIGGTGDVVADYDEVPKIIHKTTPVYPADAFIKKIEGVVRVAFIIDVDGRVRRAWVAKSVPALDAAAVQTIRQWVFTPALKGGRPVATQHVAPVAFRIY